LRLAVYTDYTYRRREGRIYAERAFALFLGHLSEVLERMTLIGKVDPEPGRTRYQLPDSTTFVELPYYASLSQPLAATRAMLSSLAVYWRVLGDVDTVWLLGPHPLAVAFALLARARGRAVFLGVRQDFPTYVRARHPGSRWMRLSADLLEWCWRRLARSMPTVVVGSAIAVNYPPKRTLVLSVSLVRDADIVAPEVALARDYTGELRILTVGRLETEKNPLLLAEILERLVRDGGRWRLLVCGEGPLAGELADRCAELGVGEQIDFLGYVTHDDGLQELYRDSHALVHVSWTEGVPQVLFEAFAARLPVVATDVGGVAAAAGGAALLSPPGDAGPIVELLERVCSDVELRAQLTDAGVERVRRATIDVETERVAAFLAAPRRG